jgi:hypothetical protein
MVRDQKATTGLTITHPEPKATIQTTDLIQTGHSKATRRDLKVTTQTTDHLEGLTITKIEIIDPITTLITTNQPTIIQRNR